MRFTTGHRQRGLATVEFALVGLLAFVFLFGALEFARTLWVANTLTESTRRGARLAAVCPPDHPAVRYVAAFNDPDGTTTNAGPSELTEDIVSVEYLDIAGALTSDVNAIRYVRVSITDYRMALNIPLINPTIVLPRFSTTLPAESLGFNPDDGTRECFGS